MILNKEIEEEFFALKFEMETLAEITIKNESERWVPGLIHSITENDHLERYKLASSFVKGKNVLDIACGVGKGSLIMKTTGDAFFIQGCDLDPVAIRYAQHRNYDSKISFNVENAEKYISEKPFDTIVSFETIEHLKNYNQFLENCSLNLTGGGQLIISTPISAHSFDNSPSNPYHNQEWGFNEFQNLLQKYFTIDTVFVQLYQNSINNEKIADDFKKNKTNRNLFFKKIINRFLHSSYKIEYPAYETNWHSKLNYSKIEKYVGQYPECKLGVEYIGYQIIVCNKK